MEGVKTMAVKMKRILIVLTGILMLMGMTMVSTASDNRTSGFRDVSPTDWYFESVTFVNASGLMTGVEEQLFRPDDRMTRAMIVTILYRLENSPEVGTHHPFSDVPGGQWYTDAVLWAAENGIVNGYEDGTFRQALPITREQLVTVICRYAAYRGCAVRPSGSLDAFSDAEAVSDYATEAFRWALEEGMITGTTPALLSPKDTASRAQAAAIFARFCRNLLGYDFGEDWARMEAYAQIVQMYEREYGEAVFYTWEDNADDMYPTAGGLYFADLMDLNRDGKEELVLAFSGQTGESVYQLRGLDVWEYTDRAVKHSMGEPGRWYGVDMGALYFETYPEGTWIVTGAELSDTGLVAYGFRDGEFGIVARNGVQEYGDEYVDFGVGRPEVDEYLIYGISNTDREKLVQVIRDTKYQLGL